MGSGGEGVPLYRPGVVLWGAEGRGSTVQTRSCPVGSGGEGFHCTDLPGVDLWGAEGRGSTVQTRSCPVGSGGEGFHCTDQELSCGERRGGVPLYRPGVVLWGAEGRGSTVQTYQELLPI